MDPPESSADPIPIEVAVGVIPPPKQWMFNGKPFSNRVVKYTWQWNRTGVHWEEGDPKTVSQGDADRLTRKGIRGYYVVGQDSIDKLAKPKAPKRKRSPRKPREPGAPRGRGRRKRGKRDTAEVPLTGAPVTDGGDTKTSECVVCMDAPVGWAAPGCGHLCMCQGCVKKLSACPMCRRPFGNSRPLRIFSC